MEARLRDRKRVSTVRFALATEGPWTRRVSTMGANPAQAARCSGEDPFSSAALHDASYVSSSSTMCLNEDGGMGREGKASGTSGKAVGSLR